MENIWVCFLDRFMRVRGVLVFKPHPGPLLRRRGDGNVDPKNPAKRG